MHPAAEKIDPVAENLLLTDRVKEDNTSTKRQRVNQFAIARPNP